ncbi:LuxR family transcriptional regulator [Dactylosporangium sp. AC04546]|uniref:helix-turn-helix transcriptional regulator n=1 Tax=Dactylosporangium sp. AC04546 TaxID=2862460 RepID=UPI001EDC9396|nr:LuxR family transcriptional regulator [Dactylosporangium sp. AC04546]WVK81550.1 LuxR family transcriptional regulator [Dactylosporangium sp. AC04546]
MTLRGRQAECDQLERLLKDVRAGQSRVLVLRGEAGIGKSALLGRLVELATGCTVVRTTGVEPETELAYSGLHQLCAPLLEHRSRLPEPQRDALEQAFGLRAGDAPDGFRIGLAVLGLLAEAAAERPLVCAVDDAQWLDPMSELILTFVARRLGAESVALVFAARPAATLRDLPSLPVEGLADADARALLDTALTAPLDPHVRDRIVAETRGNPLALLELPRGLGPAELAFGFGAAAAAPLAGRIEQGFQRRIEPLPADTRRLLLAAAVEPVGDVTLLWRALDRLGVPPGAQAPAEAAGLVEFGPRVRFRHPLARSAAWRGADPAELRAVHAALAAATSPSDPDRRAWHRAHAATGPDEEVAAELEHSAGRALDRGGRVAAAAFLERAAELTADPARRAARTLGAARARFAAGRHTQVPDLLAAAELGPLDEPQRAAVDHLRAQLAFARGRNRESASLLLAAARRLAPSDPPASRETRLQALGAVIFAGRSEATEAATASGEGRVLLAPAAEAVQAAEAVRGDGPLADGLAAWCLDGYAAAVAPLTAALTDADARWLWLTAPVAVELWDDAAWLRLTARAVAAARAAGNLAALPGALAGHAAALLHTGDLTAAAALLDEADGFNDALGARPVPVTALWLAAWRGQDLPALDLAERVAKEGHARAEGRLTGHADQATALLHNGLGRYPAALDAARRAAAGDDLGLAAGALGELAEAACRSGETRSAKEAAARIGERARAAGTDWAFGAAALARALTTDAETDYREAIERLDATSGSLTAARARLVYGEWLRRDLRRTDARDQLRAAHTVFAAAGALGFAERARRELAATGEKVVRPAEPGQPVLTPQETQIARLAADGHTNPEIGAELFLSARTVEWHLRKVFTKLGVGSRKELRAALSG